MPRHQDSPRPQPEPGTQLKGNALTTSRREFLAKTGTVALGGSAAISLLSSGSAYASGAKAKAYSTPVATLPAAGGTTFRDGVQHFLSRPDLQPPSVAIDKPYDGDLGGLIVTECVVGPAQSGVLLIDQTGRVVWSQPAAPKPTQKHRAFNARVQQYKGKPVLCWWEGEVVAGHGQGNYVIYDTSYRKIAEVHGQNGYWGDLHDFVLTDRGTALFTAYGYDTTKLERKGATETVKYFYGVVQEVDVATGKLLFEWRSDHHVDYSESYVEIPTDGQVWDYFHVNSITIDPADNHLIIGSRNTWAGYKIHSDSGEIIWKLGGKGSDFKMGKGSQFSFQHDINMHAGGVMTVFDNAGGPPQIGGQSRGLLLSVNEKKRRVDLIDGLHHAPPLYAPACGSVQPLPSGGTFVGWGRRPYFTQYDREGKVVFDGHLSINANMYRAYLQPWDGMPDTRPDVAIHRSGTTATVHVSWNGATKLDAWEVLGGSTDDDLIKLGVALLHGFETAITIANAPAYIAVRALDSAGAVLATSKTVKT